MNRHSLHEEGQQSEPWNEYDDGTSAARMLHHSHADDALTLNLHPSQDATDSCSSPVLSFLQTQSSSSTSNSSSLRSLHISNFDHGLQRCARLYLPTLESPTVHDIVFQDTVPEDRPPSLPLLSELINSSVSPIPNEGCFLPQRHVRGFPSSYTGLEEEIVNEPRPKRPRLVSFVSLDQEVHDRSTTDSIKNVEDSSNYHYYYYSNHQNPHNKHSTLDLFTSGMESTTSSTNPIPMPRVFRPTIRRETETTIAHTCTGSFSPSRRSAFSSSTFSSTSTSTTSSSSSAK